MAFPLDPYGNPIPTNPGFKRITQSDGTTAPARTNLALAAGLTITDDVTGDTSTLGGAVAPAAGSITNAMLANSGGTAGRVVVPVLIDQATLTAASQFAPTAWAAGTYRKLMLYCRVDSGTLTGSNITLTGLTAGTAYVTSSAYSLGAAASGEAEAAGASWAAGMISARARIEAQFNVSIGGYRDGHGDVWIANGGTPVHYIKHFHNTDTTNEVTALVLAFTGGTATGYAELYGIPA